MNTKLIKELIGMMDTANLKSLEVTDGGVSVKLEKNVAGIMPVMPAAVPQIFGGSVPTSFDSASAPKEADKPATVDFNNLQEIRSPLVGVFYASPSPDSPPFVKIGKKVKKGDVLCIVEAMKQMNEITAEIDGEVADICVKNGDIVEYHQVMFKIF